jgi:hypothetical protein
MPFDDMVVIPLVKKDAIAVIDLKAREVREL